MKKIIAIIFAGVLLVVAVAPKVVGLRVERNLKALVEAFNQSTGYQASITHFEQGWFGTRGDITVGLDTSVFKQAYGDDADKLDKLSLEINFSASHGPVLPGTIGWLSWQATVPGDGLREILDWPEKPLYSLQGVTGLSGASVLQDAIPPFSFKRPGDNTQLNFSGYQGAGRYSGGKYDYSGKAESLVAAAEKMDAALSGLAMELTFDGNLPEALRGSLFDSEAKLVIDELNISDKGKGKQAFVKALRVTSTSRVNEQQLADLQVAYQAADFGIDSYTGRDFSLEMAINNISGEFILAYQKLIQSLAGKTPEQMKDDVDRFFREHLLDQLRVSPEFQVSSLRFTLPEGGVNSSFIAKLVDITEMPAVLEDRSFWLGHAQAEANLKVDRAVAEMWSTAMVKSQLKANPQLALSRQEIERLAQSQAGMLLEVFVQQGSLNKTAEGYSSSFTLEGGKAMLNGRDIPLPL